MQFVLVKIRVHRFSQTHTSGQFDVYLHSIEEIVPLSHYHKPLKLEIGYIQSQFVVKNFICSLNSSGFVYQWIIN